MSNDPQSAVATAADDTPDFSPRLYSVAVLLGLIIIAGFWLVSRFAAADYQRDLQNWQEKLNLIAESRNVEVQQWVGGHFKELRTLADNPSMQLYLAELQMSTNEKPVKGESAEPPQQSYLRNLLIFTAARAGFTSVGGTATIPANVTPESKSGLAVLNKNHEIVVSTLMLPATKEALIEQAQHLESGKEALLDLQKDKDGTLYIGFAVPIYALQGEHTADAQMGTVIGIKTVDTNLFGLLKHPGAIEETLESIIVRGNGEGLEYISPLQDGTSALSKQPGSDKTARTSEAKLMKSPGNFISDMKDYRDKDVLATSRKVADTPWTLVVKIDREEALKASGQRRASMVTIFLLIIAVITLLVAAIWWYTHSQRSMMMSHHFRKMAFKSMAQEKLLRLVADHQPEPIYIVDHNQVYQFANKKAADEAGMALDAMLGKTLTDVRGAARAETIGQQCTNALLEQETEYDLQRLPEESGEKVVRSAYVPIEQIPVAHLPRPTPGVLVVEQDISEIIHEREERLRTQSQLVKTLVNLVDKRDPFAANHSLLVSELASSIAGAMELDNITMDTARVAGSLMNIGKIVVPTELLTKTAKLSEAEKRAIHDSMNIAGDLINEIHFSGPVADTLRQWQEKWDGTGPRGLHGEGILISARIISVANAFVGMISPRSWRNAMTVDAANKFLLDNADTAFDRRVVIALNYFTESSIGKAWLKHVMESKKNVA